MGYVIKLPISQLWAGCMLIFCFLLFSWLNTLTKPQQTDACMHNERNNKNITAELLL